jgi:hypothetical protein
MNIRLRPTPIAGASAGDEEYSVGCGIGGDDQLHIARCSTKVPPDDRQGEVDHVEVEDREKGTGKEDRQSKPAARVSDPCFDATNIGCLSGTRTYCLVYRRHGHHSFPLCDEVWEERLAAGHEAIDALKARMQDEEKKQRRHCGEHDRPKQRTYFVCDARLHVRGARAGLIGSRLAKKMLETVNFPRGLTAPRFVHRGEELSQEAEACDQASNRKLHERGDKIDRRQQAEIGRAEITCAPNAMHLWPHRASPLPSRIDEHDMACALKNAYSLFL